MTAMTKFCRHPLSTSFGQISADEESELKASIAAIGCLDNRIALLDGMVLDGWHRYRICDELDKPYTTFTLPPGMDAQAYVIAKNHHRRHSNASQRAVAVAAVYAWKPPFRPSLGNKSAAAADLTGNVNADKNLASEKSAEDLANIADVSTRTMEDAKTVVARGAPEVIEAVRAGEVSVERAAQIARTVPDATDQVVALIDPESSSAAPVAKRKVKPQDLTDDGQAKRIAELEAKCEQQAEEVAKYLDQLSEAGELLEEMRGELESAQKVIAADESAEKVKAALFEAKRYRDQFRAQEDRMRSLMGEKNEAIRVAKSLQARLGKLQH